MTPNPQNIGAAHEEYPIRALVLAYNPSLLHPDMLGTVRQWRQSGSDSFETRCNLPNCCGGENTWVARGNAITIDPTPEQIAEERAKAGLPPQEGEALPEPSPAKGPSLPEVTQPGEGVEDGVGAELADYYVRLGTREERQAWVNTLYPEKLRLLAMTLGQRALRRESK